MTLAITLYQMRGAFLYVHVKKRIFLRFPPRKLWLYSDFSTGKVELLISYIEDMGILIIDEPENHLHEELLCKFIKQLELLTDEHVMEVELKLNQIFLITHSKSLIYNNFTTGSNYVVDGAQLKKIDYVSCEKILRGMGLSYTKDKILFVEGDTDIMMLEYIFSEYNIQVKELGNCAEIIKTFEGLKRLKNYLFDPQFVFLIDRDTRDESSIENLRINDTEYFNDHFVIIPKHEMENYYLDVRAIKYVLDELCKATGSLNMEIEEIESIIRNNANKQLIYTKKKYLNSLLRNKLNTLGSLVKRREIGLESRDQYLTYIAGLFESEKFTNIRSSIEEGYSSVESVYSQDNWDANWLELMDGKSVFKITMVELEHRVGVSHSIIEKKIRERIIGDDNSEFRVLINNILALFDRGQRLN